MVEVPKGRRGEGIEKKKTTHDANAQTAEAALAYLSDTSRLSREKQWIPIYPLHLSHSLSHPPTAVRSQREIQIEIQGEVRNSHALLLVKHSCG